MIHSNAPEHDNASGLAIRFIGSEEEPVTQEAVNKLVSQIRNGKNDRIFCYCLSLDEYGEESIWIQEKMLLSKSAVRRLYSSETP